MSLLIAEGENGKFGITNLLPLLLLQLRPLWLLMMITNSNYESSNIIIRIRHRMTSFPLYSGVYFYF